MTSFPGVILRHPVSDSAKRRLRCWKACPAKIEGAVDVTVPGVLEPGTELVIKNEGDRPMRVVADPHEILKLKTRRE